MGTPVILYSHRPWSPAQRLGAAGVVLASVSLPWWLAATATHPASVIASTASVPVYNATLNSRRDDRHALPPAPVVIGGHSAPEAVAARPAIASDGVPYRYVGQWTEGRVNAVVLNGQGVNVVVRIPGSVDPRYDVRSVDDRRVVLWDRQLRRDFELPLAGTGAPLVRPGTPLLRTPEREDIESAALQTAPATAMPLPVGSSTSADLPDPEN